LSRWVIPLGAVPRAALRLFCFPHAGAGASVFRTWPGQVPGVDLFAVQPPGREERWSEPGFTDLRLLIAAVIKELQPYARAPFAFFGHSMGALVAFETARQLRDLGAPQPCHLILSGRRAPQRPRAPLPALPLSTEAVRAMLKAYQGTPVDVLADDELVQFVLPTLQADLSVFASYCYQPDSPLDCPLTVLGGKDDPDVHAEDLQAWQQESRGEFTMRQLPGGHFYLKQYPAPFFATLREALFSGSEPWQVPPKDISLDHDQVHVWRAPVDVSSAELERLQSLCTEEERKRAASFATPRLASDYLVCRGRLREILARYLHSAPASIAIDLRSTGKPQLAPPHGRDLRFNISHSGSLFLAAVTRGAEVGVDVEKVRPMPDALELANSYFAAPERAELQQAGPSSEQAFFRCWTRKEAYMKARGEGLAFGLDRFAVSVLGPPRLVWVDREPDALNQWSLADVSPAPGYQAAVAVHRRSALLRFWDCV
jgi:medium-chain acyl-[acyl-carrier-protein] hydrolase